MSGGASPEGSAAPMVLPVPDLAGPTTQLRRWRVTDAPALAAAWRDPVIRDRLSVPEPADEASAASWISQRERAWADGVSIDLAVTDPPSGTVIGEVGLSQLDPVRRAALVGWWIAEDWRGRGRAAEAVRLVVDWALAEGLLEAVMAEIAADNPASVAVARRAGLRRVHAPRKPSGQPDGPQMLVFARTRSEGC
ncbi:MAG: GNAT family N-acetyltransferase [Acidimicrobiaceae bacterium]|nr:GNAT family N-acetyltransferase [Acidimicrobiaceae bacterium]